MRVKTEFAGLIMCHSCKQIVVAYRDYQPLYTIGQDFNKEPFYGWIPGPKYSGSHNNCEERL